jgi:hypothetical protein
MKRSQFLLYTILLLTGMHIQAQHRVLMNINYSVGVPTGNFREYIGSTSFRGWNASITYRLNEQIGIGATTGFQDFYEKIDRAVYKDADGSDISAVVTNSIQTIPLLATVQYTLLTGQGQTLQPYIGLGVGANLIMHSQFLGQFADDDNKLKLAARPELGLFIPLKKDSEAGVNIAGAFNFMPYNHNNLKNLNTWGISLGAKFPLR